MKIWAFLAVLCLGAVVLKANLLDTVKDIEGDNLGTEVSNEGSGDLGDGTNAKIDLGGDVDITAKVSCGLIGDIVILMDASSSLKPEDYALSKAFIRGLMKNMDIGADKIRLGVAVFNQFTKVAFHLNTIVSPGMTAAGVLALMDDLPPIARGTFTHRALHTAREEMFTEENGDRPDVQNIVIVLTDGRSTKQDETAKEAELLRKTDAIVFAVTVGDWNSDTQLQVLVSKPAKDFRFSASNFLALETVKAHLTERVCDVLQVPPAVIPECNGKADLLFIMDASSSIRAKSFEKGKEFMAQLVQSFIVSQEFVRVSAMTFHNVHNVAFYLNSHNTIEGVRNAIMGLKQKGSGTRTDRALAAARMEIFNLIHGDRLGVPNIIILITDGKSRKADLTLTQATLAKAFGATLITIGVGKQRIEELQGIASFGKESKEKLAFAVRDFEDLDSLTSKLVKDTCDVPHLETPVVECDTKLDVVFVLDLSLKMTDFLVELKLLVKLVSESYSLGSDRVRIGIISFNRKVDLNLKLSDGIDIEAILASLGSLKPNYGRYTDTALELLRTEAFAEENGGRPDAVKVAIIVSKGNSKSLLRTTEAAKLVHSDGITTFALTVGRMRVEEADALASEPALTYRYSVSTFDGLFSFVVKLKERSCRINPVVDLPDAVKDCVKDSKDLEV